MKTKESITIELDMDLVRLEFKQAAKRFGKKAINYNSAEFIEYLRKDIEEDFKTRIDRFFFEGLNSDCYEQFLK